MWNSILLRNVETAILFILVSLHSFLDLFLKKLLISRSFPGAVDTLDRN